MASQPLVPPVPADAPREAALVARVRAGDVAAFETLFRAFHAPMCDLALRYLRRRETAEEVVQEVFLALWLRRESWTVRTGVRAYLLGAARNGALHRLEHEAVARRAAAAGSLPLPAAAPDAQRELEREETARHVRAALAALPERARLAASLRWEQGLRHAEIAEVMGITVKSVENQLARAAAALRRRLERRA